MGLDNGIRIRNIPKDYKIPSFVNYHLDKDEPEIEIEIAYWRKCWGIRNDIMAKLHAKDEDYKIPLDVEDIPAIERILIKYLSKEYWDDNADSIWEFEEQIEKNIGILVNLYWLESFMIECPEAEVYFYDSF